MARSQHPTMCPDQLVSQPARLKHRRVHRPASDLLAFRPEMLRVDPLQDLVRTENQSADGAADVFKAFVPAEDFSIRFHPLATVGGTPVSNIPLHSPFLPTLVRGERLYLG